ncbi:MAG: dehydratase [Proteobacteria bacterium]|nr:MAG: dehydratase [Pseudomonadota bacterium]
MPLPLSQYLEDFTVGQTFGSGRLEIDANAIKRFAADFDPQPFHLDDTQAGDTLFQGLAASGWHTAALTMRLLVDSAFRPAGGVIGAGVESLQWPAPVRPGDVLEAESEVLEVRPSRSRPEQGMLKLRITTTNQDGKVVQTFIANLVVKRFVP